MVIKMNNYYEEELCETIKKSELCAQGEKDFALIKEENSRFLNCEIIEEKETIHIIYDIYGKQPLTMLKEEGRINQLKALLEILSLQQVFCSYHFSMNPDNLYYDRNYRIYVKKRDIYEKGVTGEQQDFIKQYQALCASMLQKKYSFADYYEGGADLYKKNILFKQLYDADSLEKLEAILLEEYSRVQDIVLHQTIEVKRSQYKTVKWGLTGCLVILAVVCCFLTVMLTVTLPRKNAFITSANGFLEGNYIKVIDSLEKIDIRYMDQYQKYILAVSYIKSESLTPEQKGNILETIEIKGEEKLKEYWIYLGRLDVAEAKNIAMQRSDNELLLYAYMTEKAMIEKDTEISGEEKSVQLNDLEKKIEELAKQYDSTEAVQE